MTIFIGWEKAISCEDKRGLIIGLLAALIVKLKGYIRQAFVMG